MHKITSFLSLAALAGSLALSGAALAQEKKPFDGQKFFDSLMSAGYKAPAGFDSRKFFEEVTTRGYSDKNKIDGKKFFDMLQSAGFSAPAGFDGKKFWDEQSRTGGWAMPPMVDMTK